MDFLQLKNISKLYSSQKAVDGVTFSVEGQSIFGLLGPNGAGKTTLIRMITNIIGVDEGEIILNGTKLNMDDAQLIGYMPEERGLYKKMKVGEQLVYLAQLKNLSYREAKQKIQYWLEKFQISDWWNKKTMELSKGMQQKMQFIATVVHEPKLIILDEPFSGLDPINSNLIKNEIYELRKKGVTVIFSTHRMEQVEEICDHIVLINKGKILLNGEVKSIKQQFKKNEFSIHFSGKWDDIANENFELLRENKEELIIRLKNNFTPNDLLKFFIGKNVSVTGFNEILPSLNEIFIEKVNESSAK